MTQLLVSDGTAPAFTSGVLANGAIAVLKKSAAGLTQLVAGETITDSDHIQFVQGTGVRNIYSPWIPGNQIIRWTGASYSAQVAQANTLTFATTSVAAGDVTVKLTATHDGGEKHHRKSVTVSVPAGTTAANVANLIMGALTGLPSTTTWSGSYPIVGVNWATVSVSGAVITVTGSVYNIAANTVLGMWDVQQEGFGATGITTTCTVAQTANPFSGYGDPNFLKKEEQNLQGMLSFYNRVELPNTPATYVDVTTPTTYDVYTLVWRNPAVNQINGVDNTRTLKIAYKVSGTDQANFEARTNGYMASVPGQFAPVVL